MFADYLSSLNLAVGKCLRTNPLLSFRVNNGGDKFEGFSFWDPENKYEYNKGSELQRQRVQSDGSGLELV